MNLHHQVSKTTGEAGVFEAITTAKNIFFRAIFTIDQSVIIS